MASLGFEVCEQGHLNRSQRWRDDDGSRRSSFSSMKEYLAIRRQASQLSTSSSRSGRRQRKDSTTVFADEYSVESFVSDASSADTATRRQRKRKCALWLMAIYMTAAATIFVCVLLWRTGVIFQPVSEELNSLQEYSNWNGYDEQGRMLCNGLALNCHRRANEIMYATVHNAMSSREDGFLAYNNLFPLEDALMAGFRGLAIDSCDCARVGIQLCHGVCVAGFRRPMTTFAAIVEFMEQNMHEVVVIEIQVAGESLGPLFDILSEVPGFRELLYDHPNPDEPWPTLKDMVLSGKRLIIFAHNDLGCEEDGNCPVGVKSTYDYAFETPFAQRSATELMNLEETCRVNRGWSDSDWVISNHFANNEQGLPDLTISAVVNSAENLQVRLDYCQEKFSKEYGQSVINLLVVDFWNVGATLEIVQKYNSELPAMTDAPSELPSFSPTESPQQPLTTNDGEPVLLSTLAPTVATITNAPTIRVTPMPTSVAPTTNAPTIPLTQEPSDSPTTIVPETGFPSVEQTSEPEAFESTTSPTAASLDSFFDSILGNNNPDPSSPAETTVNVSSTQNPSAGLPDEISLQGPTTTADSTSMPLVQQQNSSTTVGFDEEKEAQDSLVSSGFTYENTPDPVLTEETQPPSTESTDVEEQDDDYGGGGGHSIFLVEKDPETPP